ncbi:MAG: L-rhamnose/proton symporter RhaT [Nitrospiraceae bacterium]|nr:L-rhamnose/proton symporter RhaT [Nitrospiraceae bacterium]
MEPNPLLGVLLHAIGGLAAGSFYIPYKRVKNWAWESYWLVGGFFSWIIAPWVAALATCPDVVGVLRSAPGTSLFWTYFFGVLWGVGGLTFGLSMRYLGMSLGYALALGFCAAFGTIIPPIFNGEFVALASQVSGRVTLGGVAVCLGGIAVCGLAGMRKEREAPAAEKTAVIKEFNFSKGLWVAVFAGVMSACMAFAFAAGKPIADLAIENGAPSLFQNYPVLIVALAGGFTTNFVWCVALNVKNRSSGDYVSARGASLPLNYLFAALAGVTWYFQFFFYGMGTTRMGRYDFSSWTIHMAFIIIFSNLWGLYFREWRGSSKRTHRLVFAGLLVLLASTAIVGLGSYLAQVR